MSLPVWEVKRVDYSWPDQIRRNWGEETMPDPDPSDPRGVQPVNRIPRLTDGGLFEMRIAAANTSGSGGGVVLSLDDADLDRPEALKDIVPRLARASSPEMDSLAERWEWESVYRMWYDLARSEIDSGRDRAEIRALFLGVAENSGEKADAVREALEDVLASLPPRYKHPLEPEAVSDEP